MTSERDDDDGERSSSTPSLTDAEDWLDSLPPPLDFLDDANVAKGYTAEELSRLEAYRVDNALSRYLQDAPAPPEVVDASVSGDEESDQGESLMVRGLLDVDQAQELESLRLQLSLAQGRIVTLEEQLGNTKRTKVYETPDDDLNPAQLAARRALAEETTRRESLREERVTKAQSAVASKASRGSVEGSTYNFTTGRPVKTDVIVARGVVSDPTLAGFEIIPLTSASSPHFVFTDETVNGLYGDKFVQGFEEMGYVIHKIVLPDGEDAKTLEVYAQLADHVLSVGIDKNSILISLGGGAVANVCGFIASTLHRGIGLIHFPTTLLAQCDASISHKQAVNAPHGKNLVGSYYAPLRIIVDTDVLQTLEDWLLPDGMGEIVKHALCQDVAFLEYLENYNGPLNDPVFLDYVVRRTIELKCEVIDIDPKENKEAVVLIYGHTIGHPIESISHRMGSACCLSHGQAVAIGCVIAARVAVAMDMADEAVIEQTEALCAKYNLPHLIPSDQSVDRIMAKLPFNKTYTAEGTMMALVERPGKIFNFNGHFKCPVDDAVIRQAIVDTMAPFGTIIKGSGSSGILRKNKLSSGSVPSLGASTPSLLGPPPAEKPGEGWAFSSADGGCPKGDC